MARYTRHQLKEDKFAVAAEEAVHWTVAHRNKLVAAGVIAAVLVVAAAGFYFYQQSRETDASLAMNRALRTYNAELRAPDAPAAPNLQTFTSVQERAKAAQKEFQAIVDAYGRTRTAKIAKYFLGTTAADAGDSAAAEKHFKDVMQDGGPDLAASAKFALAALYRAGGREADAIKLYKELADKPTSTVPKVTAQLELAAIYEKSDPTEAKRIYEQIRKDEPSSPAAEFAASRLGIGR